MVTKEEILMLAGERDLKLELKYNNKKDRYECLNLSKKPLTLSETKKELKKIIPKTKEFN